MRSAADCDTQPLIQTQDPTPHSDTRSSPQPNHERKEKTDASGSYFSIEMSETDLEAGIVNGELPCQFA